MLKAKYSREMGRIREKVTLSLRKAIEVIGLNVGPPPNPEHPNFMPRWDFSQSTDEITGKKSQKKNQDFRIFRRARVIN